MPISKDGTHRADVILNNLGVNGRMNPSQLYEQELNFIADYIIRSYRDGHQDFGTLKADLLRFYELTSTAFFEYLSSLDEEILDAFITECVESGKVQIHQPPFYGNVKFSGLQELYKTFDVPLIEIEGVRRPLVMGDMYFIKLILASPYSDVWLQLF